MVIVRGPSFTRYFGWIYFYYPLTTSSPLSTPAASQAARDALAKDGAQGAANLTYQVALQNLGPGSVVSFQRRARIAARTSIPIPRQSLKAPPLLHTTPQPNNSVKILHQWEMLHAFRRWERIRFAKIIYSKAWTRVRDHASWILLAEDEEQAKYVYHLIHFLPHGIFIV